MARQEEETRRAILAVAGREFSRNGYRQTRIADIIAELGITPQTLYGYFPTKRDLFAAAYRDYLDVSMGAIEPRLRGRGRPRPSHLLWRMVGDYSLRRAEPGPAVPVARGGLRRPRDHARAARRARARAHRPHARTSRAGAEGPDDPPLSDELISYALYGAFQTMRMRASWDERFSRSDVMWTNVALNLAVLALYDGTHRRRRR